MASRWFASPDRAVNDSEKLIALDPCPPEEADSVGDVGASRVRDLIE
jgi:hypothetical protein